MPELRENTEWTAKGIHPHTPPYTPIARLADLSGRQGLDVLDVRSSSLLAALYWDWALAFFFLTARHNKQANKRKTNTGWAVA